MSRTDTASPATSPTADQPTSPTANPAANPATNPATSSAVGRRLSLASVDDYLGPGERRFFGSGYRRVRHEITDVTVGAGPSGDLVVSATAEVEYPHDWSTKAGVDMRPHLSSVDILVLGAQLSEVFLTHVHGLDGADRRSAWLRTVKLRAGLEPQEELTGLPATATRREVRPVPGDPRRAVSVFDTRVGAMRARCEIEHPVGHERAGGGRYATIEDVLGPSASRHYGDGFKAKRPLVQDVEVDLDALDARASVVAQEVPPAAATAANAANATTTPATGLEGDHQPSLSMVDGFVTGLQLTQVLMYELDSIDRSGSNTLWMLRTVLEASSPDRPWTAPLPASAAIVDSKLLPVGERTYRTVDVVGGCGAVSLRASLAHALPHSASPSSRGSAVPRAAAHSGRTSA